MLPAKKLESLLNGGGTAAGLKGLENEIAALRIEMDGLRQEAGEIPARRTAIIAADDFAAAAMKLETREREIYLNLERGEYQLAALEQRLEEIRAAELIPLLAKYRTDIDRNIAVLDEALTAAVKANEELARLSEAASRELGALAGKLPVATFAGVVTPACLAIWRNQLKDSRDRLANQKTAPVHVPVGREIKNLLAWGYQR